MRDNLHSAKPGDIMLCKTDSWSPLSERLVFFFKGHFFNSASVAFPLNSSSKGRATQREAVMERKCREVQGSVMGGYLLCARSVADECVFPSAFGSAEKKSSVEAAASVSVTLYGQRSD